MSRFRLATLTAALSLLTTALFAAYPTARTGARMVYDPATTNTYLFGGETATDNGTKTAYSLTDTWKWNGTRWSPLFPAHNPPGRSDFSFVWETTRNRALLFGGLSADRKTVYADTWIFQNGDWTQLSPANSPRRRYLAGAAYDPIRDKTVLFGGTSYTADDKSTENLVDTWEFDGSNWVQRSTTGPTVLKPALVYDEAHNEMLMIGIDANSATLMYRYNPADASWSAVMSTTKIPCANESGITFNAADNAVLLTGGVCTTSSIVDDTYEWDGTDWKKIELKTHAGNAFGQAIAFDRERNVVIQYGGTAAFASPQATTYIYRDSGWVLWNDTLSPAPRSLFTFRKDDTNGVVWLLGGFNDSESFGDLWKYSQGMWTKVIATGGPDSTCSTPVSAYDTDRKKLVVVCSDSSTFEWSGTAWQKFTIDSKKLPPQRRFGSMVYDKNIKKTVWYGGYADPNYSDETWTWDGTAWTRVKRNPAPARALTAMWFDPTLNRTVIYGGIGRPTVDDRITRYTDMWSFDGNGWTEIKPPANPGARYGAQIGVNPVTKEVILFGGLKVEQSGTLQTQVYANDTWSWDGASWKQLTPSVAPPARENGSFEFDPSTQQLTLFGGYSGFYHSDVWTFSNGQWTYVPETPVMRRRVTK